MKVAVLRETFPGERRVALVPDLIPLIAKVGWQVVVEAGAGQSAGFTDSDYLNKGAEIVADRRAVIQQSEVVLQVRSLGANPVEGRKDLDSFRRDQVLIGMCDPLGNPAALRELADRGVIHFAMELIPRITRAQSMDVLSSQANIAGYKAVMMAADRRGTISTTCSNCFS